MTAYAENVRKQMSKFYRVKQTNFMWEEGAILEHDEDTGSDGGYRPIEDLWDHVELGTEYISGHIIEDEGNAEFFERVYPLGSLEKKLFGTKKQAQAAAAALYKGDK